MLLDLENMEAMSLSVMMATWGTFLARDAVFERGTRSLGKRWMKLGTCCAATPSPLRRFIPPKPLS